MPPDDVEIFNANNMENTCKKMNEHALKPVISAKMNNDDNNNVDEGEKLAKTSFKEWNHDLEVHPDKISLEAWKHSNDAEMETRISPNGAKNGHFHHQNGEDTGSNVNQHVTNGSNETGKAVTEHQSQTDDIDRDAQGTDISTQVRGAKMEEIPRKPNLKINYIPPETSLNYVSSIFLTIDWKGDVIGKSVLM